MLDFRDNKAEGVAARKELTGRGDIWLVMSLYQRLLKGQVQKRVGWGEEVTGEWKRKGIWAKMKRLTEKKRKKPKAVFSY